ncbi:hypothetical protein FOXG_18372 [Fusarium oxysporum f. sp. lycopersici 4287]|uniref:Uncharacterized protein n=2 Tax=Fusarium oxysporum TaxID=5507 RepID=A0A0J9UHE8_FUSO4|nr:hypothetical protein FOXG_18372 [Fusarium oxysporum f. sp. lycopersici 4287]EXK27421.1 hypothetical protein FOMG_16227 [Fusarium oxysporum f. sp. melonis 26406]KNA98262.1 hypothetical protein FOXG_18372 [Fusarium oxysporum f. sp. lycopersici 4287]
MVRRNLKLSNGNLHALAAEVYRRCPPEVVQAAEYIMQVGESNGGIGAEAKQVHMEKLRFMLH